MTKIGFFTDLHSRLDNPICRSDFYPRTCFLKLEMMEQIWKDEGVDFVMNGGDTTHIPSPSLGLVHDLTAAFRKWQRPIITITGSHDIHGYQSQTLRRTAVGTLAKSGLLTIIGSEGFPKYADSSNVRIYGTPHTISITDDPANFAVVDPEMKDRKVIIQLVHADLLDHPAPWPSTLTTQVNTDAHVVLSGHYHPGFPSHKIGNTLFMNPGSIGRIERGPSRWPKVLIITVLDNLQFTVKEVPLPLPDELTYPFTSKEEEMTETEVAVDVNRLLTLFEQAQVQMVDIKGKVPVCGRELGLSQNVIERTIKLLEEEDGKRS